MTKIQRVSAWGWFVRAFAAGFGVMCGVMVASSIAIGAYALLATGFVAIVSSSSNPSPRVAPILQPPPNEHYANPYAPPVQSASYAAVPYGQTPEPGVAACPPTSPYVDLATDSLESPQKLGEATAEREDAPSSDDAVESSSPNTAVGTVR